MRYKIVFSYDGSCFNGLESQPNQKTIQGSIEKVLTEINNNKTVKLSASGRTDKGVHALNQVAHFDLDVKIKNYGLKSILNKRLNGEIYIKDITTVDNQFHARYQAKAKIYSYYINTKEYDCILKNYVLQLNHALDIKKMQISSKAFIGEHDFRSVCYQGKEQLNCIRKISGIDISTIGNGIVKITIKGNGFLRKMVRNIVSILVEAGECKINYDEIVELLNNKSKIHNIKCVAACGLYLERVLYDTDL